MLNSTRGRMLAVVTPILMFPGQSSRDPAMIERALQLDPGPNAELLHQASDILGRDLLSHYRADNPGIFATNREVQVGVFLANQLHLRSLERKGITSELSVGLSLGEYNHLVHIGALSFREALRLVDARGLAYAAGPAGAMAAVFPLEAAALENVVAHARATGNVEIGSYNSPTQHVLSGEQPAIEAALRILEDEHSVEAVIIEPRIPMHSTTFWPVVRAFLPALQQVAWQPIRRAYLPNTTGRFLRLPTPGDLIHSLSLHVWRPVRWRQSLDLLAQHTPDAIFVEVGPRAVLTGLLQRRWRTNAKFNTDARPGEDPRAAFDAVVRALRAGTSGATGRVAA